MERDAQLQKTKDITGVEDRSICTGQIYSLTAKEHKGSKMASKTTSNTGETFSTNESNLTLREQVEVILRYKKTRILGNCISYFLLL